MKIVSKDNLPNLYFVALPLVVAGLGWSLGAALLAVGVGLAWKWGVVFSKLAAAVRGGSRELRLETIAVSHYVERVRWCLDRLGIPYREEQTAGILGILFSARSVPRLHLGSGIGASALGDSPDILRYLWGAYATTHPKQAAFLEPTPEALALEQRLIEYGFETRRWLYYHTLPDKRFTLHIWGYDDPSLPVWQRVFLRVFYPFLTVFMRRALSVTEAETRAGIAKVEAFLAEMEERLADGCKSLLGGERSFVDLSFAALSGIWLVHDAYGGGRTRAYQFAPEDHPAEIRRQVALWRERFPRVVRFVEDLYASERSPAAKAT